MSCKYPILVGFPLLSVRALVQLAEAVLSVPFSEEALSVALHISVSILTAGVESSQESLHSHCHAVRETVCELYYWSPAT